ncbi:PDZ domain-containing protein [Candidatus Bathyarchaeota archaeon]|nr:PDZ domain-containing protein [Candidatus Bathyarchaeota archaeon]
MGEFEQSHPRSSTVFLMLIFVTGLAAGAIVSFYITYNEVDRLKNDVTRLKNQVSELRGVRPSVINQNITVYQNSTALSELYEGVRDSVVLIIGKTDGGSVQGSGFIYNFSGIIVAITNYHVVHGTNTISVTFANGNGYAATINGTDPYADLAILIVDAPAHEFQPLEIVNSTTLRVGDPVIAIGNPYGLVGSMTTGVVSALGRTITEDEYTGGFGIANIIQTSAPINPGNSGGPLLNYNGTVVGITTAIVSDSQGLGFAVPSNTIRREIASLVESGSYDGHSYLGLMGGDMDYFMAQEMGVDITYGWRIVEVRSDGPSHDADLKKDDILIGINGTRIKNGDDMASYLEEHTLPGDTVILTIRRGTLTLDREVELGSRPPPPV